MVMNWLLSGITWPNDGHVRFDFPGGWPTDNVNKFAIKDRTANDHKYGNILPHWLITVKTSSALMYGRFMQFVPDNGVYVYFRYTDKQTVMIVLNTSKEKRK